MKNRLMLLSILLVCSLANPTLAQDSSLPAVTISNSFVHYLQDDSINQRFKIDVVLPTGYDGSTDKYPVVYATDGNLMSQLIAPNLTLLQLGQEIPAIILVGIGYDTNNVMEIGTLRTRELTPTKDAQWLQRQSQSIPEHLHPGKAENFLTFIDQQVKPLINKHYRTDPSDQTLVGYSLGGLFGLYTLFNHTNSFDRYVIGSPSIWWDNALVLQHEENYAANNKDLAKHVFLSIGELEQPAGSDSQMVTHVNLMNERLNSRKYPGLVLEHVVFSGENHMSGIAASMVRGLRSVFKKSNSQG